MLELISQEMESCTKCGSIKNYAKYYGKGSGKIFILLSGIDLDLSRKGIANSELVSWLSQCWAHNTKSRRADFFRRFYITSTLLCRTHNVQVIKQDRAAAWSEVKNCRDRVLFEIYEVDPTLIIASGAQAIQTLVGRSSKLPRATGKPTDLFTAIVPGESSDVRYSALPIPNIATAIERGDYDDPSGLISKVSKGLTYAHDIVKYIEEEDNG